MTNLHPGRLPVESLELQTLKMAIQRISDRFFTPEEFPLLPRERFPMGCLHHAFLVDSNQLEDYAKTRKGNELEGLMLDLISETDPGKIKTGVRILSIRNTKRIRRLAAALCQYYYKSQGIVDLCCALTESPKQLIEDYDNHFLNKFGPLENKVSALKQTILEEGNDIDWVFQQYGLIDQSPLALEAVRQYFIVCQKNGLLINHNRLKALIDTLSAKQMDKLVKHYLISLSLVELHDDVNQTILEQLGTPFESVEWDSYPNELKNKFGGWTFLYLLRKHTKSTPAKFHCLAKYYERIRTCYELPEHDVLIVDFGDLVLADRKDSAETYLYEHTLFQKEMVEWKESLSQAPTVEGSELVGQPTVKLPTFLGNGHDTVTGRQYMIMGMESQVIRLVYEDIHLYYLDEVMEIKLGLEPDTRKLHTTRKPKNTNARQVLQREQM